VFPFQRLLIESDALADALTRRVREQLPHLPVETIPSREAWLARVAQQPRDLAHGKRTLLLTRQRGPFWRPCPCTPEHLGCGYQVLQVMTNCPMDCTYCILQSYVNLPAVTVFTNLDDLGAEVEAGLAAADRPVRLGTGEFGDSLALDRLLGLHERLIPLFAGRAQAVLEIKTKQHRLEHLLPLGPNPQVIFAWSLNPPPVIRSEEHGSAPLAARLAAARQAADAGFRLAFHFDPIIHYPGWEDDYRRVVADLAAAVPARAVAWISLGGLRFTPALRRLIRQRVPAGRIADAEFVPGLDGKLRYFKTLRIDLYSRMRAWLAPAFPAAVLYLCMETPAVWRAVFGDLPSPDALPRRLDACVRDACVRDACVRDACVPPPG